MNIRQFAKIYSLGMSLLISYSINFTQNISAANSQPLDLIIILDDGTELASYKETKSLGAGRETVAGAMRDEVPFLASSTLIAEISKESPYLFKMLTNNKQWFIYTDSTKQFTIGLPRHYLNWEQILISNDIEKIGLNKNNLVLITPTTLTEMYGTLFEKKIDLDKPIDVDALKNIFGHIIGDSWEPINQFSRKRLLLFGHGYYQRNQQAGFIAGLTINQYRDFLQFLNHLNVDILYVTSCYSGGNNLLKAYQLHDESISKPISLNYFLVIGSVTDNVAAAVSSKIDFTDFFQTVDHFFSPKKDTSMRFEDIVKPLWGKVIHNIPSIRFPGNINYFKAADIDNYVLPITYAQATALTLPARKKLPAEVQNAYNRLMDDYRKKQQPNTDDVELVEHYLIEAAKIGIAQPSTPIKAEARTILLYPMQLKTPLNINFPPKKFTSQKLAKLELGKYPAFISMIPGSAAHLIKSINTSGSLDLRYFVYMFFVLDSAFEKLFLIQHLTTKNFAGSGISSNETLSLTNVVIYKNEHQNQGSAFVTFENKIYKAHIAFPRQLSYDEIGAMPMLTPFTIITAQQAYKEIYELILKTQPTQQAVSQASGGQENQREIMQKMLSNFVPSI